MNHQPFRSWLLSEEPLPPDQAQALRQHLQECEACRQLDFSWAQIHGLFRRVPEAAPASGFTERWHQRLVAHRLAAQRRQAWIAMAATAGTGLLLLLILAIQVVQVLRAPAQLLLVWIARLTSLLNVLLDIQQVALKVLDSGPIIPITAGVFAFGFVCFLCVAWVAAYRQFTSNWRIA
jgi:anti-sigma factor RsiW